jgi:hypothetical protein
VPRKRRIDEPVASSQPVRFVDLTASSSDSDSDQNDAAADDNGAFLPLNAFRSMCTKSSLKEFSDAERAQLQRKAAAMQRELPARACWRRRNLRCQDKDRCGVLARSRSSLVGEQ